MRPLLSRSPRRPVRRAMVAAVGVRPGLGGIATRRRPGTALIPVEHTQGAFRRMLGAIVTAIALAGGFLSLDITGDVLRYRVEQEQSAVRLLEGRIDTLRAEIDEARRLAPLDGVDLDLLIAP